MRWFLVLCNLQAVNSFTIGALRLIPEKISEEASTGETLISTKTTVLYIIRVQKFTLSEYQKQQKRYGLLVTCQKCPFGPCESQANFIPQFYKSFLKES